ncbi:MAG: dihydropteroate synthase, partial [Candidatus Zixiibacteriota bacterium]
DSFSDGGRFLNTGDAIDHARQVVEEGADIIDVGGESSRPGSEPVSRETELARVIPVIEGIRRFSDLPISIDTTKAEVAEKALAAGADIINDISGFRFDQNMTEVAVLHHTPVIVMHMLGTPKSMQVQPCYEDCIKEIKEFFSERINHCVENGVDRDMIILDPGIGFGKRLEDNLTIIKNLREFKSLGCPLMLGASRKSFISMVTGIEGKADKRIGGSLAALLTALRNGCDIIRVHDVGETIESIEVLKAIEEA